jgi:hypothetical protein
MPDQCAMIAWHFIAPGKPMQNGWRLLAGLRGDST